MNRDEKKYPCEHCEFGVYMTVEEMWWCSTRCMYACNIERNRGLCKKFDEEEKNESN
jgi:hypothetical protein